MDPSLPCARCIAIRGGRIAEVVPSGRNAADLHGDLVIDLGGRTVLPGFVDAHCHVRAFAESLVSIDLSPGAAVDSIGALKARVRESCQGRAPGTWIKGRGYSEFHLAEKRHPSRWDLDEAAPDHPVKLTHRSGHAHVLNSLACRLAGITMESGDPPGGMIDRALPGGEPTGLLFGMGGYLANRVRPVGEEEIETGVVRANEWFLSRGITSVQDASSHNGPGEWSRFERWKEHGMFEPRVTMMMGVSGFREWRKEAYPRTVVEEWLRPGPVKLVTGEVTGSLHPPQDELDQLVLEIHRSAMQTAIHAIEENAIEAAALSIEKALAVLPRSDHRHRIEHCSVCPPALAGRLAKSGIAVCSQPSFLYESGDRYLETVPEQQKAYLYPVSTMARKGVLVAFGSDAPISVPDPLVGIRAAVGRTSLSGRVVLGEERVTVDEALRMHTIDAARAAFEEKSKGSITPGKLADLVVLNRDPRTAEPGRFDNIAVDMTIVGGKVVWSKAQS
jgi:predicted amidohydrolase YtcJ